MPTTPPPEAPKGPATAVAHAGVHGWHGDGLAPGEKVLAHWHAHHGHLVLTDRQVLLLSHPHVLTLKRSVEWASPLEEIRNVEVIQCADTDSPDHLASTSVGSISQGNVPMSQTGAGSRGAIGIQDAKLPGSFEVLVDDLVLYKGTPNHAQEVREKIDQARTDRMAAMGRMSPKGSPKG